MIVSTKNIENELASVNKKLEKLMILLGVLLLVETPDDKKDEMTDYIKEVLSED